MTSAPLPIDVVQDVSFSDALTDQGDGRIIGYVLGGDRPGANALFVANSSTIAAVCSRLMALPSLPWMWGHLYLVASDQLRADFHADVAGCVPGISFDEVSICTDKDQPDSESIDASYWQILRMCTGLGMIQGRGVNLQNG